MATLFAPTTLCLQRPLGRTLGLTIGCLLLLLLILEGSLRLNIIQAQLATSNMGSRHGELGEKLRMLDAIAANEGEIDCVALGSSVIDNGFDPLIFAQSYQTVTGDKITCFNFGIDAIPAATAGALAQIIMQDYHPHMLIYGLDGRDLAVTNNNHDNLVVFDTPWIQYRLGNFNWQGWLIEHSYTYRYANSLRQLLLLNYQSARWTPRSDLTLLGHHPLFEADLNVQNPPEPGDEAYQVVYLSELLADFHVSSENRHGFEQLLNLNSEDVQVVVTIMPVANGYYSFYTNGKADYDSFINQLENLSIGRNVLFLRPLPAEAIPADGWFDYMHVNAKGSKSYSEWLGNKIGETVNQKP